MDKSHMFWSEAPNVTYGDEKGTAIPRATYRCKKSTLVTKPESKVTVKQGVTHLCKLVTDHEHACECICGRNFNEKEA